MDETIVNPFANDWAKHTTINPLGLLMVLAMGLALLLVPRRYAVWPMIIIVCFVPSAQRVVVLGADFDLLRIMVLFGTARVLIRSEYRNFQWKRLDAALVIWSLVATIFPVMRIGPNVLVNRLGFLYDAIGMYFLFRMIVRDWDDVRCAVAGFMWISVPVAIVFALEWTSGRNLFAFFGGVPEITPIRDDRLRCQGAFGHSILAGCFWAAMLPIMAARWWGARKSVRALVVLSVGAAIFIIVACASTTPILAIILVVVGMVLFGIRRRMRWVRWALLLTIIGLHLVMKAPVWHLICRISVIGGSSSWQRFALVDGAISHFNEWWFIGSSLGTGHWGYFTFDCTNYFIVQAVHGGLLQLVLFVALIGVAFQQVGSLWRKEINERSQLIMAWAMGLSVLAHATNFFGVSYFGQVWMSWYLLLAMIGSLSVMMPRTIPARERQPMRRRICRHPGILELNVNRPA